MSPTPKVPLHVEVPGSDLIDGSLGPVCRESEAPDDISIGSAVFEGLIVMTDTQTDHARPSVAMQRMRCGLKTEVTAAIATIFENRPTVGDSSVRKRSALAPDKDLDYTSSGSVGPLFKINGSETKLSLQTSTK